MNTAQGFLSYVRADNAADGGRIGRLAEDIKVQYEMATGESLELFLDQTSIEWGDDWRKQVDQYLESTVFFVPVVTPRFLKSEECRREFRRFAERAEALGISELILSLHYVNVPALDGESSDDEIVEIVRRFQWTDWRDIRFKDVHSEGYRRAVHAIVQRLIAANAKLEGKRAPGSSRQEDGPIEEKEEPLGLIDHIANFQETAPKWTDTTSLIAEDIDQVGGAMREATAKITNRPASPAEFVYRRAVARQLARQLAEPADRIFARGNEFASQLHGIDEGIRALLELVTLQAPHAEEDERVALCEFLVTVRGLAAKVAEGLEAVQNMIGNVSDIQNLSRDLRPVLRRLSGGLTAMVEAREVTDEWVGLIESSGIECPE